MAYLGSYLFLLATLIALLLASGAAFERIFQRIDANAAETLALRVVLGSGAWITILFALASVQLLRPAPVLAAVAVVSLAGAITIAGKNKKWTLRALAQKPRPGLLFVALTTTLVVVLGALYLQVLRPIVAWDADVYHLTVPRLYLEHGGFRHIPYNAYSNWPLGIELLFALAMTVKDYILAKALHFGFGALLAILLGMITARATTPPWGVIASALLFLNPVFLFEMRLAYVDIAVAVFLLAGFLFVHRALDDSERETSWLLAAGVAAGVLAVTKISGFFGGACLAAVFLVSRLLSGRRPTTLLRPTAFFVLPVLAFSLPWLIKAWWFTGNPVYPLLYSTFGGSEWSAELGRQHAAWQQAIGMGRSLLDYLLLPIRVMLQGGQGYEHFDGRLHPLWVILIPIALVGARRHAIVRRALATAGLWFVLWSLSSQQMRFLIPILPLLALAFAVSAHDLIRRLSRPALPTAGVALLVGALTVQASFTYLEQIPRLLPLLWSQGVELRAYATDEVFDFINTELPSEAKLVMVNVNRGFFCHREFVADSFFEASQISALLFALDAQGGLVDGLERMGITHVLVESQEHGPLFPESFVELLQERRRWVYRSRDDRFTVVAVGSGSAPR